MVVFTFVNNGQIAGYLMAADRNAMGWRELPHDLDSEMEDVRRKGEEVEEVSVGLDGDWFLRTNCRHACKSKVDKGSTSNVELFAKLVEQAGITLADYAVQFFTFVPDPSGYITVLHKTDGTLTRCAWRNVPKDLDMVLEREGEKGVRHVTVGVNGAYVVILNSGAVWWGANIPGGLRQLLEDAERMGRPVATVSLSLVSPNCYFVRFVDGATGYSLPQDWHQSVNHYSAHANRTSTLPNPSPNPNLKMATSYNNGVHRAQTLPQFAPRSFQSNPYLSSAFTGMPQQPVYVTQVYNPMPQQPQQQQSTVSTLAKYNGVFTLLGGALKLAGAVLEPALQTDWSNFIN